MRGVPGDTATSPEFCGERRTAVSQPERRGDGQEGTLADLSAAQTVREEEVDIWVSGEPSVRTLAERHSARPSRETAGEPGTILAPGARFLDRLPKKLGRDLVCLKTVDHYVEAVSTSRARPWC